MVLDDYKLEVCELGRLFKWTLHHSPRTGPTHFVQGGHDASVETAWRQACDAYTAAREP